MQMAKYQFTFSDNTSVQFVAEVSAFYGSARAQISQVVGLLRPEDAKDAPSEEATKVLGALKSAAISSQQWSLHQLLNRFEKLDDAGKQAATDFLKSIRSVLSEKLVDRCYEVKAFGRTNGRADENTAADDSSSTASA